MAKVTITLEEDVAHRFVDSLIFLMNRIDDEGIPLEKSIERGKTHAIVETSKGYVKTYPLKERFEVVCQERDLVQSVWLDITMQLQE